MALRAGTNPNTHSSRLSTNSLAVNTVDSSIIKAAAELARKQQQQQLENSIKRVPLKSDSNIHLDSVKRDLNISSFESMSTQPIVKEKSKSIYSFNNNNTYNNINNSKFRRNSVEGNINRRSNSPMSILRKTLQPKLIDYAQQLSSSSSSSPTTPPSPPRQMQPTFSPSPLQNPIIVTPPSPPPIQQQQSQSQNGNDNGYTRNNCTTEVISYDDIVNDIKLYEQQQSEYETDSEYHSCSNNTSNVVSRKSSLKSYYSQVSDLSYLDDINRAVESVQK